MSAPYELQLVVPPKTDPSAPVILELDPNQPRVRRVDIAFQKNCYYAVGVRILDRATPYAPQLSGWIRGEDEVISWEDDYRMSQPSHLVFQGYSDADDYPHTIEIRIFTRADE